MITDAGPEYGDAGLRWQSSAILALQEASEAFLVHLFEDAYVFCTDFCLIMFYFITGIFVPFTRNGSRL
jgi:hypothetical protein